MRRRGRPRHPDILTPREWEVLSLIEQGASNDEIAKRLGVTERTAKYHVSEILSKLGVSSREEAVAAVGERSARTGVLAHWALTLKIAAAVGAVAALAGVAVLGWSVAARGGDGDGDPSVQSVEEAHSRVLAAVTRPGEVLHTYSERSRRDATGEQLEQVGDSWSDPAADAVRSELRPGPDWPPNNESTGESLTIASGEFDYFDNAPGDAYRVFKPPCPGIVSAVLRSLLACLANPRTDWSVTLGGPPDDPRVNGGAEWEGRPAVAIVIIQEPVFESEETPFALSGVPTSTPHATFGQVTESAPPTGTREPEASLMLVQYGFTSTSYLDPQTYLPIAVTYDFELSDRPGPFTYIIRYEHEFIDRSSVAEDFFDPVSIGWKGEPN